MRNVMLLLAGLPVVMLLLSGCIRAYDDFVGAHDLATDRCAADGRILDTGGSGEVIPMDAPGTDGLEPTDAAGSADGNETNAGHTGSLEITLTYEGPVVLGEIQVLLFGAPHECNQLDPSNVWGSPITEKTATSIGNKVIFEELLTEETYALVGLGTSPYGNLSAAGCIGHVMISQDQTTGLTLDLLPLDLQPEGSYSTVHLLDLTGAISGVAGQLSDLIVGVFYNSPEQLTDLIFAAVSQHVGEMGTEIALGLFEDFLSDILTDWFLNNSPDCIQDLFLVGQDLSQITSQVELHATTTITSTGDQDLYQGTHDWTELVLYWKLNCDPEDPGYDECGKHPFSQDDLLTSANPIALAESGFTATGEEMDGLIIDDHAWNLTPGQVALLTMNELLLPAACGQDDLLAFCFGTLDCDTVATMLPGDILDTLGITEDDLEEFCLQSVALHCSPIADAIDQLSIPGYLTVHGECTIVGGTRALDVEALEDGAWWGHFVIDDMEGAEIEGSFSGAQTP